MRILQITPEAPGHFSGGKIGVKQTALSLVQNGHMVDYVGPEIEDEEIRSLYNCIYILEPSDNVPLRIYDSLYMNTNRRYRAWKNLKLNYSLYDAFVLDFTKLNYVLNRIPSDRLIVRVHNVEADYSFYNYQYNKNFVNFLDRLFSGKRERQIVSQANKLLVLTEKDRFRLCELYGAPLEKTEIVPVCVRPPKEKEERGNSSREVKMIINGSLWFGPNYEGIKWFLEKVYNQLNFPKTLILAGSNPNKELVKKMSEFSDVTLVDTPSSMEPYFREADIAIAPVFHGAGMKVKVAEALSFGLPVIGTSHAFEGYTITHGINSFCSDDEDGFINSLKDYYNLNMAERLHMRQESQNLFQNNYSQICSNRIFQRVLSELKL